MKTILAVFGLVCVLAVLLIILAARAVRSPGASSTQPQVLVRWTRSNFSYSDADVVNLTDSPLDIQVYVLHSVLQSRNGFMTGVEQEKTFAAFGPYVNRGTAHLVPHGSDFFNISLGMLRFPASVHVVTPDGQEIPCTQILKEDPEGQPEGGM